MDLFSPRWMSFSFLLFNLLRPPSLSTSLWKTTQLVYQPFLLVLYRLLNCYRCTLSHQWRSHRIILLEETLKVSSPTMHPALQRSLNRVPQQLKCKSPVHNISIWAISLTAVHQLDLSLLIPTLWAQLFLQFPTHLTVHLLNLYFISFSMKMLQVTVSKALLKINNTPCFSHVLQASLIVEGYHIGVHMLVAWLTSLFELKRRTYSVFYILKTIQDIRKWLLETLTGTTQSVWSEWRPRQRHSNLP